MVTCLVVRIGPMIFTVGSKFATTYPTMGVMERSQALRRCLHPQLEYLSLVHHASKQGNSRRDHFTVRYRCRYDTWLIMHHGWHKMNVSPLRVTHRWYIVNSEEQNKPFMAEKPPLVLTATTRKHLEAIRQASKVGRPLLIQSETGKCTLGHTLEGMDASHAYVLCCIPMNAQGLGRARWCSTVRRRATCPSCGL